MELTVSAAVAAANAVVVVVVVVAAAAVVILVLNALHLLPYRWRPCISQQKWIPRTGHQTPTNSASVSP